MIQVTMPKMSEWIKLCGGRKHLKQYYKWYVRVNGWIEKEFPFSDWCDVEWQLHQDELWATGEKQWDGIKEWSNQ